MATSAQEVPGIDVPALAGYLDELVGGLAGRLSVALISGGRSNLTYLATDGRQRWVVRRPPLGHVLATAHDMTREAAVLTALAGTDVPVPEVVGTCADASVLGAPFYVMRQVDGVVLRTTDDLDALPSARARALGFDLIDVLARLHRVDPYAVGLGEFGRPEGYLERQVRRWGKQRDASHSREVAGLVELGDRLGTAVPESPAATIVHGDYRLDNVIVDAAAGRILAVLDWEMATLGDPLADVGLSYLYWVGWEGIDNPIATTPGAHPNFPTWAELAARYAADTGFPLDDLDWYIAFGFYKLAVILEGIHFRHVQGLTVGGGDYDYIGPMVPVLVDRGLAALQGQVGAGG